MSQNQPSNSHHDGTNSVSGERRKLAEDGFDMLLAFVGRDIFVRQPAAFFYVGTLIEVTDRQIALDPVAWVADTGRFGTTMNDGFPERAEIEVVPGPMILERGPGLEILPWNHGVPDETR